MKGVFNEALTYERAHEALTYDPETGKLRWRDKRKDALSRGEAGCKVMTGYIRLRVDGVDYPAHRVCWLMSTGAWPKQDIDHINRVKDDNRIANLRDVPRRVNSQNQTRGQNGNLIGTSYCKANRNWWASIGINYRTIRLGSYATQEEAHAAYMAAKRQLHPEFPG
jgi:hypothetical protein